MGKLIDLLVKGQKPIIGVVHLAGLPGSVHFQDSFEETVGRAVDETRTLAAAGFDGVLFQNTGDVPASESGDEATVAFMAAAGIELRKAAQGILGVNVLMNGSKAALAVAKATRADFVRIKINTGVVAASTGLVQADPHEVLSFRNRIGAQDVDMIGDLYDRTAAPVGKFPLEVLGDLAARHADIGALVVSGYDHADLIARLNHLRGKLPKSFLVVGGGANIDNLPELLQLSDGIIVDEVNYKK